MPTWPRLACSVLLRLRYAAMSSSESPEAPQLWRLFDEAPEEEVYPPQALSRPEAAQLWRLFDEAPEEVVYPPQALCDFTLTTKDGGTFRVHTAILAGSCKVFDRLLQDVPGTKAMSVVETAHELQVGLLDPLYRRPDMLSPPVLTNMADVRLNLELARKYQCEALTALCDRFLYQCELSICPE